MGLFGVLTWLTAEWTLCKDGGLVRYMHGDWHVPFKRPSPESQASRNDSQPISPSPSTFPLPPSPETQLASKPLAVLPSAPDSEPRPETIPELVPVLPPQPRLGPTVPPATNSEFHLCCKPEQIFVELTYCPSVDTINSVLTFQLPEVALAHEAMETSLLTCVLHQLSFSPP